MFLLCGLCWWVLESAIGHYYVYCLVQQNVIVVCCWKLPYFVIVVILVGAGKCHWLLVGARKCHWLVLESAAHHIMLVVFVWVLLYYLALEHAIATCYSWLVLGWCWNMP